MLKRIPKSDISIRPFKAYKTWTFVSGSTDVSVLSAFEADYTSTLTASANGLSFYQNALYGQLRAQFYNGTEDNVFIRSGYKTNVYNADSPLTTERFLSGSATIISIPQRFVGDGIKPGSVKLNANGTIYVDDGFSNIGYDYLDIIDVSLLDFNTGEFNFTNYYTGTPYSCSVESTTWDMNTGQVVVTYPAYSVNPSDQYSAMMYSWDSNATPSLMYIQNLPFLDSPPTGLQKGNVFYNQGLIVLTRDTTQVLQSSWSLEYKSTETIYEHEYLCVVNEQEFNTSTNPTAVISTGAETEWFQTTYEGNVKVITKPGVKYVRKRQVLSQDGLMDYAYISSVNSAVSGGFEQWEAYEKSDPTGSYLMPMITTIGLYDDNMDLVAVAKLPKPIKSMHNMPVNFLVRFDM
jgi:hypothetical protein